MKIWFSHSLQIGNLLLIKLYPNPDFNNITKQGAVFSIVVFPAWERPRIFSARRAQTCTELLCVFGMHPTLQLFIPKDNYKSYI